MIGDQVMWSGISISLSIFCLAMVLMSIGGDIRRVANLLACAKEVHEEKDDE